MASICIDANLSLIGRLRTVDQIERKIRMPSIFAPCRFYLLVFLAVFNQAVAADPAHPSAQCSEQQATELPSVPPLPPVRTLRVRPRSSGDSLNADAGGPPAPTTSGVVPGNDPKAIRIMPIKPDRVDGDAASGAGCAISS
jgi:hypothetical protein